MCQCANMPIKRMYSLIMCQCANALMPMCQSTGKMRAQLIGTLAYRHISTLLRMKELHLSIVSPEKEIFDGEVNSVTLPGAMGSFTILPQHAPIVSSLKEGKLSYVTDDNEECTLDIQGGFVEMSDGKVSVCVS